MAIETKTVIKYDYKCNICNHDYIEQRGLGENAYFTKCNFFGCTGDYALVNQTESTYQQEVLEPIVVEEIPAEVIEAEEAAAQAKADAKASAQVKLAALGLTADEIAALN